MLDKSLDEFGTALHSFQDTYSHQYLTPLSHAILGHNPDKTELNVTKAYRMAESSFYLLRGMNAVENGFGDKTNKDYNEETSQMWTQIKGSVLDYLKLENKSQTNIAKNAAVAKNGKEIKSK